MAPRHHTKDPSQLHISPATEICLELNDHSTVSKSAIKFFGLARDRFAPAQAANLAEQLISLNRPLTTLLDVCIDRNYDGSDVELIIGSGSAVGAVPLISPSTAKYDDGLVVQPRFPWPGIGPMLGEMGWRVTPSPLKLPLLHRSERRVPPWVVTSVARSIGAQIKSGRLSQTTRPIEWQPSHLGSQKSLKPDIWLEWESTTLIVDAKYKRHWEELSRHSWSQVEEELRERHRNDIFQVLAYANLAQTRNVIACLVYPCSAETWADLKAGERLLHKASLSAGRRAVHLWLTAVPMSANAELRERCQRTSERFSPRQRRSKMRK